MKINRRKFVQQAGWASMGFLGASSLRRPAEAGTPTGKGTWSFIHYTDVHVQPELRAGDGYRQAVRAMNQVQPKPAFAIAGGDLVFDAFEVGFERAQQLYELYKEITQDLDMPLHHVIGNHDVFGVSSSSGVSKDHLEYGKKMFASRVGHGRTYTSFDFQDWHFVLLDSVFITPQLDFEGRIDPEQSDWLQKDLRSVGAARPIVLVSHIPFFSILPALQNGPTSTVPPALAIVNSKQVLEVCSEYNVRLILQGHVHIVEDHQYKKTEYVTSGAVCGNWWKGPRMGHPEGFAVYTIHDDRIEWRYHTYGWQAVSAG